MANTVKVTKRDMFNKLLAIDTVANDVQLVDFINHEVELLDKKRDNKKPTKVQTENEDIKTVLLSELANGSGTITELQGRNSDLSTYSNQKLSALLKQLVESNSVNKTTDKGKSIFSIV